MGETIQKRSKSKQQGITLIALVVTIVILLILAGVTINLLFSDTGLFQKAQQAENAWRNAEQSDINAIGELTNELMEILGENPRATDIYVFLYDDGTLTFGTQNEQIEGKTVLKQYGNIKGQEYSSWAGEDKNYASNTPWFNDKASVTKVSIIDKIVPTSMASWFVGYTNLTEIEHIENIDTSEVESMKLMFAGCSSLTSLDLSSFDTSNVIDMNNMFYQCNKLTGLNLSSFNTSKVEDVGSMFDCCSSLTSLDLSSFDTSNIIEMGHMFNACINLIEIVGLEEFNTSKVESMAAMFAGCSSLTSLDLSNFDSSNLITTDSMFAYCTNLTTIYVGDNWDILNVENTNNMFYRCGTNETTPKESN